MIEGAAIFIDHRLPCIAAHDCRTGNVIVGSEIVLEFDLRPT